MPPTFKLGPVPDSATDRRTRRVLCGVCVCLSECVCMWVGCKRDEHIVCCTFSAYSFFLSFLFCFSRFLSPTFWLTTCKGNKRGGWALEAAKRVAVAALTCYVEIFCIFTLKSRSQRKICKVKRWKTKKLATISIYWTGPAWSGPARISSAISGLNIVNLWEGTSKVPPLPPLPPPLPMWLPCKNLFLICARPRLFSICPGIWLRFADSKMSATLSGCLPQSVCHCVCVWAVGVAEGVSQSQSATRQLPVRVISRWYL